MRTESFSVINTPCFTLCVHFNIKENFTVVIFATFSQFIFILIYFILFVLVHLFYLIKPFSYFIFNYLLFDQSYLTFLFHFCLMELFNLSN